MKTFIIGFFTPWIVYAGITLLHIIIPAFKIKGYVKHEKTGEVLNYRINGIFVLVASVLIWYLLGRFNIVPFDRLYQARWTGLAGAAVMGLFLSFIFVLKYPSTGKPFLADFFLGRIWNPQFKNGFIDTKMWLYLIGADMLLLNTLSFVAHHLNVYGTVFNPGIILGLVMTTWFCFEYLFFERVHLYTYDIFAERTGFKLIFGCLAFYPYFYAVSMWATVNRPSPGRPAWFYVIIGALFLCGWTITRGANMQKYFFKKWPNKKFLWIQPQAISEGNRNLLVNGYWGASRHINYLGEIIQAVALALAAGYPGVWQVWLYPLYYVGLLFTRQYDDDKICGAKYGELWNTYTKKVKYKIIPFIY